MVVTGAVLALLGLVFFVMLVLGDDPGRAWRSYHVNFLFFTGLSLGGIIFERLAVAISKRLRTADTELRVLEER